MTSMPPPFLMEAVERIEGAEPLDPPAKAVGKTVRDAVPPGPVKDALSGTWIGHALHPLLTDLPIGTWTSAVLLDWLGGEAGRPAADRLIALGIAFTVPASATGLTEWGDSEVGDDGACAASGITHAVGQHRRDGAVRRVPGRPPARRARDAASCWRSPARAPLGVERLARRAPRLRAGHRRRPDRLRGAAGGLDARARGLRAARGRGALRRGRRGRRPGGAPRRRAPRALQPLLAPRRAAGRGRAGRRLRHLPAGTARSSGSPTAPSSAARRPIPSPPGTSASATA